MIRYTHRLPFVRSIRRALLERAEVLSHAVAIEREELGGEAQQVELEDLGRDPPDQETAIALLQLGEAELGQVNHALDLIDLGTYGTCETCGRDIPKERLLALPLASRCIACQHAIEAQ